MASTFPRWTDDTVPEFVYRLSAGLAGRGHEIHVLAPHDAGAARHEVVDGLRVHRFVYAPVPMEKLCYDGGILENLRRHPMRWSLVAPFMSAQFVAMLRLVRRYQIEAIHAHWLLPQGLLATFARPVVNCPVIVSAHGGDVFAMRAGVRRRLLTMAARRADICTANSNAMRSELARLTGVDATVIPMGVDPSKFHPADWSRDEQPQPSSPLILFVGRLVEKKGVRHLIQAMPAVRSVVGGARLQIVGDGPERESLEALTQELDLAGCVDFVGPVPNAELPAYYGRADLFVAPSVVSRDGDTEGLGVVLLEAAASGLAIVASRIGGIPDIVEHEKTGLLVEPGEPAAIASAVTRLLSSQSLRQSLANNARRVVMERFSWQGVVDRFDDVFSSLPRTG